MDLKCQSCKASLVHTGDGSDSVSTYTVYDCRNCGATFILAVEDGKEKMVQVREALFRYS
jgi:predicted RNA-binding Zn-ribbon protein involved in translation (DUF1610 family)